MTLLRTRPGLVVAALALILASAISHSTPRAQSGPGPYTLIDLGTLGGGSTQAFDINETGQITGYSTNASNQTRAFLWDDGQMTNLGLMGGHYSSGRGLNVHGHVVGFANIVFGGTGIAALFRDGAWINVTPDIPAGQGSQAVAINDHGQVLGFIGWGEAFVWDNGSRTTLGHLGGGSTFPTDINNDGKVVGSSATPNATDIGLAGHPFVWQNGVMKDLGVLPGDEEAGASGINSLGVIVGYSGRTDPETYEQFYRPFIYDSGSMTAISAPSSEAYAADINDAGDVVGTMRAGNAVTPWHAWIYKDGVVTNLNSVKPTGTGLHLAQAHAINNAGQITGIAMDAQGRYHGFLLTPGGVAPPPVAPTLGINDVSVLEGRNGTTAAIFTVNLSAPTTGAVLVTFTTANGTAVAGSDYIFTHGTLTFNPGETSKTITVAVNGDRQREGDETFRVNLSNPDGATIFDGTGSGVIRNDDK